MLIQVGQLTCSISVPELPPSTLVSVQTKREQNPKCILQLFLGSLLGTRRSAIGQFFPRHFPFHFLKGEL